MSHRDQGDTAPQNGCLMPFLMLPVLVVKVLWRVFRG